MKKDIIKIDRSSGEFGDGFTIWINGRWVLDASCFTDDFMFSVDTKRMKIFKKDKKNDKITYKWDKRFKK